LVNSYTYEVQPVSHVIESLVERLLPVSRELDCVQYLEHTVTMATGPTWAERQTAILEEAGDAAEVVRHLSRESRISAVQTENAY
jgi:hypothetical protein